MALTSGFFNSLAGDRKYDAEQMGRIFEGVITDGIFAKVGNKFEIKATGGRGVSVGTGRAWFNNTWTNNDAIIPIIVPEAEMALDRVDRIVLEVNTSVGVRANSIKLVAGTPSSTPVGASLVKTATVNQYLLAEIYVKARSTTVTKANITNRIGTADAPYVVGAVQTVSVSQLVAQWNAKFDEWFDALSVTLSGDVAGNLANQVNAVAAQATTLETGLNTHKNAVTPHPALAGGVVKTDGFQAVARGGPLRSGGPVGLQRSWEAGGMVFYADRGGGLQVPATRMYEISCNVYVSGGHDSGVVSASVLQWRGGNFMRRLMNFMISKSANFDATNCVTNIRGLQAGDVITLDAVIAPNLNIYGNTADHLTYLTAKAI